jgi:methionyl-tRNA formyltransferase
MMDLAKDIAKNEPTPIVQSGKVTAFQRRIPKESEILDGLTIEQAYNHIRMLDADTYPKGFLAKGALKFELSGVKKLDNGTLSAQVIISEEKSEL